MPDPRLITEPVDHDPFGFDFQPVDHNPFASEGDQQLSSSMTHQPQGPNAAPEPYSSPAMAPYREVLKGYYAGGAPGAMRGAGVEPPGWLDSLVSFLRSGPVNDAMSYGMPELGMARWAPAEVATLRNMVKSGALDMEQLPGRTKNAANVKMSQLGLALSESPNYVAEGSIKNDPEKIDQLMQILAKRGNTEERLTLPQIADQLGVSERTVRRYMTDEMNVRASRGVSWDDPERIASTQRMVAQGYSVQQMADAHGINVGTMSKQLAKMREAGHLPGYAPMGGTGLTAAGRKPTTATVKFMEGEVPDDKEMTKAVIQYLRSRGLHASLLQGTLA